LPDRTTVSTLLGGSDSTVQSAADGFDDDLTIPAKAEVVGVDVGPDFAVPSTLDAFEDKIRELSQAGKKAQAVMLCNPNNPLGFNYPRATLVAYAAFCERHNLHLVSDEIYALSQFHNAEASEKERVGFTSMLSVDVWREAKCNPARVHVLYGVAKDFGMNGLRIGKLIPFQSMIEANHRSRLYSHAA
jgi:1-aminocyclopropane-1-carboxylate synthase